jgi:hypothetical protein
MNISLSCVDLNLMSFDEALDSFYSNCQDPYSRSDLKQGPRAVFGGEA